MNIVCIVTDPSIEKFLTPLKSVGQLSLNYATNLQANQVINLAKAEQVLITGPEAVGKLNKEILQELTSLRFIFLLTIKRV